MSTYIKSKHCPKYERNIRKILACDLGQNFSNFFVHILGNAATSYILSRSAHRTPNFTNPEFQFPQFKVLQIGFSSLI